MFSLNKLTKLSVSNLFNISAQNKKWMDDNTLRVISTYLTNLTSLNICNCECYSDHNKITDRGVKHLQNLKYL
jgi:hypothetical protein